MCKRYNLPKHAFAYVDDPIGLLTIVTEDGAYSYRWPSNPWTLTQGLSDKYSVAYITDKLLAGRGKEYDEKSTIDAVKELVLRDRRQRNCTAELAREAWEELEHTGLPTEEDATDTIRWFARDTSDYIRERPTAAAARLREQHIPALLEILREKSTNPL